MTKTEKKILQILWDNGTPMCAADIINADAQLKEITVRTTLANMLKKELIRVEGMVHRTKSYARAFVANVTSEEIICREILESKNTTPFKFAKALINGDYMEKEELQELFDLLSAKIDK